MRAIVLVGGFGTRLRPLTLQRPKQLLPIVHRSMLEVVVERLGAAGVTEVILSVGFEPDQFRTAFPDGVCAGVPLTYAQEPEPLDTAGAIAFAARTAGVDEPFLALNGDVISDLDHAAIVEAHLASGARATIALTPVEDPSRYGVVVTDEDGRVTQFIEKPPPGTAPSNRINAGAYVLSPDVIDLVPVGQAASIERDVFPALAAEGTLRAFDTDGYWVDAGTPASYLGVQLDLIAGRGPGPALDGVHPSATIHPGATVVDAVIGAGAVIGDGATVTRSVVMAGAQVGPGSVVEESLIGGDAHLGEGVTIRNLSVVGFGATVTDGATLDGGTEPPRDTWA